MDICKNSNQNVFKKNKNIKNIALSLVLAVTAGYSVSMASAATAVANDDWLHVEGNQILDQQGNKVWLTGANWFGFNTTERVLHGLWSVNLEDTINSIADRGINLLRVPISTELLLEWQNDQATPAQINDYVNPNLEGATTLDVFDAMVEASKAAGLKILLDVHGAEADNMGHIYALWYKDEITSEDFYASWEWIAERYKNDDTIIAFDLENEPHGKPWSDSEFAKWDNSTDENNWKYACETASNRILDINSNMLIMCEGIESSPIDGVSWDTTDEDSFYSNWWGGNLRPVRDFPIDLGDRQSQFMYSPHDYGPLVFQQPWFYEGFSKDTLYEDVWKDNWMFIHEENISPLLIGEWGGFMDGGDNETWMYAMQELIIEHGLHHTFWCINPNSGDTGGLLDNSWVTWDEAKYAILKPTLWQNSAGKFISLDHEIALGAAGISLNEHYATTSLSIVSPLSGSDVTISSIVSISYDLIKATSVNVYINNLLAGTGTSSTASITVPSSEGEFTLVLKAVDSQGAELSVSESLVLNATAEMIVLPSIDIVEPVAASSVAAGSDLSIVIALQEATGFSYQLDGVTGQVVGTSAVITAPYIVGDYTLSVTALDADNQSLSVTDEVSFSVMDSASTVSCEVGVADGWDAGFVINSIVITNDGESTISEWTAVLSFAAGTSFGNGWGGDFAADGQNVTVTNLAYNGQLVVAGSTSIGLQGTKTADFVAPTCIAK